MSDHIPVACCLSDVELRQREATLLAQFKSALVHRPVNSLYYVPYGVAS
jgi:hypothetical protein